MTVLVLVFVLVFLETLQPNSRIYSRIKRSLNFVNKVTEKLTEMGNCLSFFETGKALPVESAFQLPSPLLTWPPGTGFGLGTIDLGGLQVCQITSFDKVWSTREGGPDNLGATFFEPSSLPEGFFMLGCYSQPNNQPLHGWVLAGKDQSDVLREPIDYTLLWSSESLKIKQDGIGYIWIPVPPDGYRAVGHVVTSSQEKPSMEKVRCVRADFTDQCEANTWIWGPGKTSDPNGFNVFNLRPKTRGTTAMGVPVGTFIAQNGGKDPPLSLVCLRNNYLNYESFMPNLSQIEALIQAYSPWVYFHPGEAYFPSSVSWFFNNGALLYKKGEESKPIPIDSTGSNLPQGGSNDGAYWLDLPVDGKAKERVKRGDLQSSQAYFHIKPMYAGTFTDIAIWVFYPFNGPARAKVEFFNVSLGKIGEHVGDWEHLTLRVSNFSGELWKVYFAQHSKGVWVDSSEVEFQNGNKVVAYASLHGHASYPKPGLVLQGSNGIGIRNDTAKSKIVMDTGENCSIVAAEYLNNNKTTVVEEPPWLNYFREWGPKVSYDIAEEIKKADKHLPGVLRKDFEKFIRSLPNEVLGEEGPTGPKMKNNWNGDEA
ncbi:uncharacterized protein LOC116203927 [Punica granatum]|uniref:Uncharacterized protein LOC116203927 n=2 Tax=Punica granatum TaxID=22663 RepID=A0A6P8D3W6_PUNGR|nr:uncharacterized protein LOC116203927 [Punica granatum]